MNEIQRIVAALEERGAPAVLATLVHVEGASYRPTGSRMLIFRDGNSVGTLTAGCLESEICEQAFRWTKDGPCTRTFEIGTPEDNLMGWGSGCKGTLKVLLERVERHDSILQSIAKRLERRETYALATVFEVDASSALQIGDRTSSFPSSLRRDMQKEMQGVLRDGKSRAVKYSYQNATLHIFMEVLTPPIALFIFGASDGIIPIVRMARQMGWDVTVSDKRDEVFLREKFSEATRVTEIVPGELPAAQTFDPQSVALVMSHQYADDMDYVRALLRSSVRYVGLLGSRKRNQMICDELTRDIPEDCFRRLFAPVGLDIGARDPNEIALSIIAEIVAVLRGRTGGFLRDAKGRIHAEEYAYRALA